MTTRTTARSARSSAEHPAKDLVPLTVEARLATVDEDGIDIVAIAAVWEGKSLVTMLKAELPSKGNTAAPATPEQTMLVFSARK